MSVTRCENCGEELPNRDEPHCCLHSDAWYVEEAKATASVALIDIDFDGEPVVSRTHTCPPEGKCRVADEDGAYVQAWVWVDAD